MMEFNRNYDALYNTPSSWVWSDGSAMNYTAWAPGQPSIFFLEEKLCIKSVNTEQGLGAGTWDDQPCWFNIRPDFLVCKMSVS